MWTQNFNFKLNVYTNEHNQSVHSASSADCLTGELVFVS
jgi:hypothetical protein